MISKTKRSLPSLLFTLLIIFSTFSCSDEDLPPVIQNDELKVYLDRFEEEAAKRGYDYDLSDVEAVFVGEIKQGDFCGYGYPNYEGTGRKRIEILRSDGCWNNSDDSEKEILMFHEIGHAFFGRLHEESALPNQRPNSIMCSECYLSGSYNEYQPHRREYYIDELIDPETDVPEWGVAKENFELFWQDDIEENTDWKLNSFSNLVSGELRQLDANNDDYALTLSAQDNDHNGAFWFRRFIPSNFPEGATIKLEVKTREGSSALGEGIALQMNNYKDNRLLDLAGTNFYPEFPIRALNLSNNTYSVIMSDYTADGNILTLFLRYLPNTTGEVIFDDIKVYVAED